MATLRNPFTRRPVGFVDNEAQLATNGTNTPPQIPARTVAKPTSHKASGLVPAPNLSSESGSSQPVQIQELVPELVSPATRRITYASMLNDAGVDVSIRAVKTPVLGAEFFVEPASDSPQDLLIAEFIESNLFGGISAPFINVIEDILRFYEDGYSVLEKVYELRSWAASDAGANTKQYTMLKKLGIRPESTVSGITYDNNGGPATITQQAIRADNSVQEVQLTIDKLMIFTFNRRGGDIRGRSILRTAYPHWYYKTHMYKIDAIQKERHSLGVPKGKLLPGYNTQDRNILRTLLRNLRANEESFILTTPNVDVEFAEVKGNLVDVLKSADHHNMMIMLNVMAQFLVSSSSSGRATAATQVDMFMKSLRYVANYIADVANMYLIPELVVWNFPTTNFPKICVKNLGETADLQKLAAAFANLFAQGALTSDVPTENFIRKVFDMPAKQPGAEPTSASAPKSQDPAQPPQAGNQKGNIKPGRATTGNNGKPVNAPPV